MFKNNIRRLIALIGLAVFLAPSFASALKGRTRAIRRDIAAHYAKNMHLPKDLAQKPHKYIRFSSKKLRIKQAPAQLHLPSAAAVEVRGIKFSIRGANTTTPILQGKAKSDTPINPPAGYQTVVRDFQTTIAPRSLPPLQ